MKLNELKNKKVLILGFGKEGVDTFKFLRKLFPKKTIGLADQLPFKKLNLSAQKLLFNIFYDRRKCNIGRKRVKLHFGEGYLRAIKNYDIIIKTPGIPPKIIKPFLKKGQRITSQTEIFFENCPGKIVGITGTKGKSTTASLIYQILKTGTIKAHLVGNIGKPVLSYLSSATKKDVYVYELSSHQLMNLKHSPQVAVFLNIYPEHGDYYQNFNEYLKAKQNICLWQKREDYFIFNPKNKFVRETAKLTKAKKISLGNYSQILKNLRIKKSPLLGRHNLLNLAAAVKVGEIFNVSEEKIKKAIAKFKPLPHRLEFVGKFSGIKFYNDSLSTIPETTIQAIDALEKNLQTIILGGFDRGQDFRKLAKKILKSNIKTVILFPTTGKRIWQKILALKEKTKKKSPKPFFVDNMKEAVKLAFENTQSGKICLLSPAAASFNLFKNYAQRGNLFKKYVKFFGKNEKKEI